LGAVTRCDCATRIRLASPSQADDLKQVISKGCAGDITIDYNITVDSILSVASKSIDETVQALRAGNEVSFSELAKVCRHYFGAPRIKGSHHIYKTPWPVDPRINIQNEKGKSKRYQVRQLVEALDKLADMKLAEHKAHEKPKKK
jgi:hypothetical protein